MSDIYLKLAELRQSNIPAALCTVIRTSGSTPRKAGSKMIVFGDGTIFGTIGGGSIELAVTKEAVEILKTGIPQLKEYQLVEDLQMKCGGNVEVFIDPIMSLPRLMIFGAGHIGRALGRFAASLGFALVYYDSRPDIYKEFDTAGAECNTGEYAQCIADARFDVQTYIVITTHKHSFDEEILAAVARKPHAYLGMIGSKRKVAEARKRFLQEGLLTEEELNKVDMPMGIPINVETPEEIAISIIARIIDTKNSLTNSE